MTKLNTIANIKADGIARGDKSLPSLAALGLPSVNKTGFRHAVGSAPKLKSAMSGEDVPAGFHVSGSSLVIDMNAFLDSARTSGAFADAGLSVAKKGGNWAAVLDHYLTQARSAWDQATRLFETDDEGKAVRAESGNRIPLKDSDGNIMRTNGVAYPVIDRENGLVIIGTPNAVEGKGASGAGLAALVAAVIDPDDQVLAA